MIYGFYVEAPIGEDIDKEHFKEHLKNSITKNGMNPEDYDIKVIEDHHPLADRWMFKATAKQ